MLLQRNGSSGTICGASRSSQPDPHRASEIRNLERFIDTSVRRFASSLNYDICFISSPIPDVYNISAVLSFWTWKAMITRGS